MMTSRTVAAAAKLVRESAALFDVAMHQLRTVGGADGVGGALADAIEADVADWLASAEDARERSADPAADPLAVVT